MDIESTTIPGVIVVNLRVFEDERGLFTEIFDEDKFAALGLPTRWPHDSLSLNRKAGTVRGLHFQVPPSHQPKLVRVSRGAVFDVVVDLRVGSPTHGQHIGVELRADRFQCMVVPHGCAHGFVTTRDDTEIVYKMGDVYRPDLYRGLRWDDPVLGISWPVPTGDVVIAERDLTHPDFADFASPFVFEGAS